MDWRFLPVRLAFQVWVSAWPVVLTTGIVASATRFARVALAAAYFVVLFAIAAMAMPVSPDLTWGQVVLSLGAERSASDADHVDVSVAQGSRRWSAGPDLHDARARREQPRCDCCQQRRTLPPRNHHHDWGRGSRWRWNVLAAPRARIRRIWCHRMAGAHVDPASVPGKANQRRIVDDRRHLDDVRDRPFGKSGFRPPALGVGRHRRAGGLQSLRSCRAAMGDT